MLLKLTKAERKERKAVNKGEIIRFQAHSLWPKQMSLRENIKTKLWAQVREQWTTKTKTTFTVRTRQPGASRAQRGRARQTDRHTADTSSLSLSFPLTLLSPFQPWAHLLSFSPPNHPYPTTNWNKTAQVQTATV